MQDYDDTGVGRHGSPPPSYDMYGDDDDERAVGSRTPHHGDGGQEEEDGRYLMDHHEFDQSSGGESISPLYGGGLQRDEPVSAWGSAARVRHGGVLALQKQRVLVSYVRSQCHFQSQSALPCLCGSDDAHVHLGTCALLCTDDS
jgi:hypothetical protein